MAVCKHVKQTSRFMTEYAKVLHKGCPESVIQDTIKLLSNHRNFECSRDHKLKGRLKEYRECHILGTKLGLDLVLVYRYLDNGDILELSRIGKHDGVLETYYKGELDIMKFLKEERVHRYKYHAVSPDGEGWYDTLYDAKKDLPSFIPYGQDNLDWDERVVVYDVSNAPIDEYGTQDISDIEDYVFAFYDNKLYYQNGRVVDYAVPKDKEKKTYTILGSDGKYYDVKAFTKAEATRTLNIYLKGKK